MGGSSPLTHTQGASPQPAEARAPGLRCGDRVLSLEHPVVMGVLNVTPDSFSDGGRYSSVDEAVAFGERMVAEGAAIIDVGGESTRPGAVPVPLDEELRRVLPVIEKLASRVRVVISVDTSQPEVMRRAIEAGASLVNDVRALRAPGALEVVAATEAGVCLMHMRGEPHTMQQAPEYSDVVAEVREFLADRVRACRERGVATERLCVDPGFGFGKRLSHNLQLVRGLDSLGVLGLPVLVGMSRKSLSSALAQSAAPGDRLAASLTLAALAVQKGARIVRAHDVAATLATLRVIEAVCGDGSAGGGEDS